MKFSDCSKYREADHDTDKFYDTPEEAIIAYMDWEEDGHAINQMRYHSNSLCCVVRGYDEDGECIDYRKYDGIECSAIVAEKTDWFHIWAEDEEESKANIRLGISTPETEEFKLIKYVKDELIPKDQTCIHIPDSEFSGSEPKLTGCSRYSNIGWTDSYERVTYQPHIGDIVVYGINANIVGTVQGISEAGARVLLDDKREYLTRYCVLMEREKYPEDLKDFNYQYVSSKVMDSYEKYKKNVTYEDTGFGLRANGMSPDKESTDSQEDVGGGEGFCIKTYEASIDLKKAYDAALTEGLTYKDRPPLPECRPALVSATCYGCNDPSKELYCEDCKRGVR